MTTQFDEDTALVPIGDGAFLGTIVSTWSVGRGPNGGYLAAIILRALTLSTHDPARAPRSLTVQYLTPPVEGPIRIETTIERAGGAMTMLSARAVQNERTVALAMSAFSAPRTGIDLVSPSMPDVPPPEALAPPQRPEAPLPSFASRYDYRWAVGDAPFSGSPLARTGGWIRLGEPRVADALLVAAFADGWIPSVYPRLRAPAATPTIDLTIHFRTRLPLPDAAPQDFYCVVFQSRLAAEGFFEEDGEIWSRDGVLIAQSRQLALLYPFRT